MDLDAPPPSYEVATGVSGSQQPLNLHFSRASRPSPSVDYDEEVKTVVSTTLIFPQSQHSRPTQHVRRISPQTNNILRRPQSKSSSKTCICFFTLLMLVITIILILVLVIKSSKPKAKATIYINTQLSDDTKYDEIRDWEAKLRQNNLYMYKRLDKYDYLLQKRRDESKWNFNTHQDND